VTVSEHIMQGRISGLGGARSLETHGSIASEAAPEKHAAHIFRFGFPNARTTPTGMPFAMTSVSWPVIVRPSDARSPPNEPLQLTMAI
jgi:hypothetical protein